MPTPFSGRFRLRWAVALALAVLFSLCANAANAIIFQGTFRGIAFGTSTYPVYPIPGNFDGEVVTGSFFYNTSNQGEYSEPYPGKDEVFYFAAPGTLSITVQAHGHNLTYTDDLKVYLHKSATEQYISFNEGSDVLFQGISLMLAGPLFDDFFNLESLHAGTVDLNNSFVGFSEGRYFGGAARLISVDFIGMAVPEPQSLSLVVGAMIAAITVSAKHRRWSMRRSVYCSLHRRNPSA